MITRAQMPRQLRDRGGIMTIKTVRQKYGLGDFVRKLIPKEIARVAEVAAPFLAVTGNPLAGAIAGGLGRFQRTGDLGSSALYGGAVGLGGLAADAVGATKFLAGKGFDTSTVSGLKDLPKNILLGSEDLGTKGLFGAKGGFSLGKAIGKGTQGVFL